MQLHDGMWRARPARLVEVGGEHAPEPTDEHFDGLAQLLAVREAREVDRADEAIDVVRLVVERERDRALEHGHVADEHPDVLGQRVQLGAQLVAVEHALLGRAPDLGM